MDYEQELDGLTRVVVRWLPIFGAVFVFGCAGASSNTPVQSADQANVSAAVEHPRATPEFTAAAKRYFAARGMKGKYETEARSAVMARFGAEKGPGLWAIFEKNTRWEAVSADLVEVFASLFTAQELDELSSFFESSTAKKESELGKVLESKIVQEAQRIAEAHAIELAAIRAAIEKDQNPELVVEDGTVEKRSPKPLTPHRKSAIRFYEAAGFSSAYEEEFLSDTSSENEEKGMFLMWKRFYSEPLREVTIDAVVEGYSLEDLNRINAAMASPAHKKLEHSKAQLASRIQAVLDTHLGNNLQYFAQLFEVDEKPAEEASRNESRLSQ